jgi:hypothetical protein
MRKGLFIFLIFVPLYLDAQERDTIENRKVVVSPWQEPGYQLIVEGVVGIGIGDFSTNFGKVSIINSVRLNRKFALGIGTGIRFKQSTEFTDAISAYKDILLQIYADFRTNFSLDKRESYYYAIGIGSTFFPKLQRNMNGLEYSHLLGMGFLINPSAGMNFRVSEKIGFHAGVGCEIQLGRFKVYEYNGRHGPSLNLEDKLSYSISLTSGLTF